ncbi:C-type lectin-like [Trinorchestia longiramus]|nr:C-type lectin-like [Trinorchestia longiramus]
MVAKLWAVTVAESRSLSKFGNEYWITMPNLGFSNDFVPKNKSVLANATPCVCRTQCMVLTWCQSATLYDNAICALANARITSVSTPGATYAYKTQFELRDDNLFYWVIGNPYTYDEAVTACKNEGARLAIAKTNHTMNQMRTVSLTVKCESTIDLKCDDSGKTLVWGDGTAYDQKFTKLNHLCQGNGVFSEKTHHYNFRGGNLESRGSAYRTCALCQANFFNITW